METGLALFDSGPQSAGSRFGVAVAGLGDINADGVPDFAIGAPGGWAIDSSARGVVHVFSGATRTVLRVLEGPSPGDGFGETIVGCADVDGDSVPDFAVASPGYRANGGASAGALGRITVFSGATLDVMRVLEDSGHTIGASISAGTSHAGDSPFIFAPVSPGSKWSGFIAFDARSGVRRTVKVSSAPRRAFGSRVVGLGDLDRDGVPEIAVSSATVGNDDAHDGAALVEVFSGSDGRTLFAWRGVAGDAWDLALTNVGDMTGDAMADLAIGLPNAGLVAVFGVTPDPVVPSVYCDLQRSPQEPDADCTGHLSLGPYLGTVMLALDVSGLEPTDSDPFAVYLEAVPDTGGFVRLGELSIVSVLGWTWAFGLDVRDWAPPDLLRFKTLAELAECRIQVRRSSGEVVLQARIPVGGPASKRLRTPLRAPLSSSHRARGALLVRRQSRRGSLRLRLVARGLERSGQYDVWVEDRAGSGVFSFTGELVNGRLSRDSRRGDPLPHATADGLSLRGCTVEVREGSSVLLVGLVP